MIELAFYSFFIACLLILQTYVFYPLLLVLLAKVRSTHKQARNSAKPQFSIAILIAAFNEEKVIAQKIESIISGNYPLDKLKIYVGSDASTDRTDQIIQNLQKKHTNLYFKRFESRTGKIGIINALQTEAGAEVVVLTDANVMFEENTLVNLLQHFEDTNVGLVAANIVKVPQNAGGITRQEKFYLSFENKLKSTESDLWRIIMGAEGGCFAIKNENFVAVPANFVVDDFFLTLKVLEQHKATLFEENARCYEDLPSDEKGEFRRKVRISSGNFQNLFHFKSFLLRPFSKIGFAFWSHKVLRWLTPFFLIICLVTSAFLALSSNFFAYLLLIQLLGLTSPLVNRLTGTTHPVLKFIGHFYLMNLALFAGYLRFLNGIKTSIWQPVNRDV